MRRSKYRAIPTVIDGIRFASKAEAKRYQELRLLERAGEITALELQPRYPIHSHRTGERVMVYVADFRYLAKGARVTTVEDVKGVKTPVYRLKKKFAEAEYGIQIQEIACR